ncbi:hypothetical protein H9L12_00875 [Sphingomonas rhizophila]|uniref:Uncharacterized protein n=1 Tax=Sphingomonas rhizophila TaxID=2071607 RepID=A0A7G9SBL3_9SPHN|nr:hypothetical protein [Sphingomonas rhizophila]QNN65238.1 hypothetical protein H9L12_00875 [Sphingomonas rhizophila]
MATLEQLRNADWFANVGVQTSSAVATLPDWPSAIASCSSPEWENLCLEAANHYRERLLERSPQAFSTWNDVVNAVKPSAMALVHDKTRYVVAAHSLPSAFSDTVNWDILHLCMEAEFADVFPPGFYASQAYWYERGHFPCGWRGPFPEGGHLVIF